MPNKALHILLRPNLKLWESFWQSDLTFKLSLHNGKTLNLIHILSRFPWFGYNRMHHKLRENLNPKVLIHPSSLFQKFFSCKRNLHFYKNWVNILGCDLLLLVWCDWQLFHKNFYYELLNGIKILLFIIH